MNSRHARIPDSFDAVAHRFRCQSGFFGNRNIARSGGHNGDFARAEFGFIAENTNDFCRFVPFGIGVNITNVAVNVMRSCA